MQKKNNVHLSTATEFWRRLDTGTFRPCTFR
jgi:hypothetical protein